MSLSPELLEKARHWMFDVALPFWAEYGVDRTHGGHVESLSADGRAPSGVAFKRTRVTARQLYVYSHAQTLGWSEAGPVADHFFEFLTKTLWDKAEGGWPRTVDARTGAAIDQTPDLYDYAFALFALGWRHRAAGSPEAIALAHKTLDIIDKRFRHPDGGFHHHLPADLPRQQNPHMHLIEAALVLAETSQDARFADLADEIATLFRTRIVRLPQGVLPEFFSDDWCPIEGEKGRWIEPGHQFEWAWILGQHQKIIGADNVAIMAALVTWAEANGVDPQTHITYNGVRDDGAPLDRGSRTWPNTERIKGWLALNEITGEHAERAAQAVAGSTRVVLDRYLGAPWPPGAWMDAFDADNQPVSTLIPASTLYHVFLAFAELLRCAPALTEHSSSV